MKVTPGLRILLGLIAGLAIGIVAGERGAFALPAARLIGGLWIDALRMTIVPLVFGLVVTGVSSAARQQGESGLTRRALGLFAMILIASAIVGTMLGTALLSGWNVPRLDALRDQLPPPAIPVIPSIGEALRSLVPTNPFAAAAQGAIVPIVIFALIFGLALVRIDHRRANAVDEFLRGAVDALLVIVGWVLVVAPIGVFALAFDVASRVGVDLGAALGWYVVVQILVTLSLGLSMYLLVALSGAAGVLPFLRAALPAQGVAFSTQSSLASLPAMLAATRVLRLAPDRAASVLPMAVALFRIAAPASIVVVTLALAHLNGVSLGIGQLAIVVMLASLNTLVIAGLPNQITFFRPTRRRRWRPACRSNCCR